MEREVDPLDVKREEFLYFIDEAAGKLRLKLHLIFDSHRDFGWDYAPKRKLINLDISFSPSHLSADHYILELLEWDAKHTTLVTSDQQLANEAKRYGAQVKSSKAFVKQIQKRVQKRNEPEKEELCETPTHLKRYLHIFTKNDEKSPDL